MNRRVFTRTYNQKGLYLSGYGVRERKFTTSPSHYHFLINDNVSVYPDRRDDIEQIHRKSLDKVIGFGNENDIQVIYDQKPLIGYTLKDVQGGDDVFTIGKDGFY
jgi:hypothetical protein